MKKDSSLFVPRERQMKILLLDIENAPTVAYTWETFFKNGGSTIEVINTAYMLSFAYKWVGEKKAHVRSLRMYPTFKKNPQDDFLLIKDLHDLFCEADIIVAHNAKGHDIPFTNWRFMVHKMKAPTPYKVVDTLLVRKSLVKYKSPSNSLNYISKEQGYGEKVDHEGFPLWRKCMEGDVAAFKKMEKYNLHDVDPLLEKTYLDFRGWMPNHPKDFSKQKDKHSPVCLVPKCKGSKVYWRGTEVRRGGKVMRRYQCQDCGTFGQVPESKD